MPRARSILFCLVAALGFGLAPNAIAQDYESDVWGGPGGGAFRLPCAEGDYLVGVQARSGDWVDAVAPLCARWDTTSNSFLPPGTGPMQGGRGGSLAEDRCDPRSAVAAITVEIVPGGHRNIAMLSLDCASVQGLQSTTSVFNRQFGTTRIDRDNREDGYGSTYNLDMDLAERLQCHDGDFAVGIYGAAGAYVDRIGLICVPRPVIRQNVTERAMAPLANSLPPAPVPSRGDVTAGANTRITPEPAPSRVTAGSGLRVTPERQRPRQCIEGYTWRMARIPDPVCVTTQAHELAQSENATASSRVDPNGAWGPASCFSGYVWREAFDGDTVCVTPPRREQVRDENRLAPNFQAP